MISIFRANQSFTYAKFTCHRRDPLLCWPFKKRFKNQHFFNISALLPHGARIYTHHTCLLKVLDPSKSAIKTNTFSSFPFFGPTKPLHMRSSLVIGGARCFFYPSKCAFKTNTFSTFPLCCPTGPSHIRISLAFGRSGEQWGPLYGTQYSDNGPKFSKCWSKLVQIGGSWP